MFDLLCHSRVQSHTKQNAICYYITYRVTDLSCFFKMHFALFRACFSFPHNYMRSCTRKMPGDKVRPAHKADNLTATYELIVYKM
jgi:hypothetical protein